MDLNSFANGIYPTYMHMYIHVEYILYILYIHAGQSLLSTLSINRGSAPMHAIRYHLEQSDPVRPYNRL